MKFKIDENLPVEFAAGLCRAKFDAETVSSERLSGADDATLFERCQLEGRILITLDLDFANVQSYPPGSHAGIVVFRPGSQDKNCLISLLERLLPVFSSKSPKGQLWIVESDRIRYRED